MTYTHGKLVKNVERQTDRPTYNVLNLRKGERQTDR